MKTTKQKPVQLYPSEYTEMENKPLTPKVGVGVALLKHEGLCQKVLLGLRKGSHGAGQWALPGGHLEIGETPKSCVRRELMEETGITCKTLYDIGWTNDILTDEGLHYVTLFFAMDVANGTEAQILEPDKVEEWKWFSLDKLPENMFDSCREILGKRIKSGSFHLNEVI